MNSLFKKFLVLLIVLTTLFGTVPAHADFRDVTQENPYLPAVTYFERLGIIQGNQGLFSPDQPITRAAFIKILVGKIDPAEDLSYIKIPFTDVVEDAWYAPYIKLALKQGILSGTTGEFWPASSITWLDALQYLYRHYSRVRLPDAAVQIHRFADMGRNLQPVVYLTLERALLDKLLTPVSENIVGVYRTLSRGEAVDLLYRAKGEYQDTEMESSSLLEQTVFKDASPELRSILLEVFQHIQEDYLYQKDLTPDQLAYGLITGLVKSLDDPYSEYFPPEDSVFFFQGLNGDLEGIGAYVEKVVDQIKIIAPLKDSPAEKAGILAGDVIVSIDDVSTANMSLTDAVKKIRGPKGTSVKLGIQRAGVATVLYISVVRDKVVSSSVAYKALENNIAYFSINQFLLTTPTEFIKAYQDHLATTQPRGIILDLRNNPGGYLNAAITLLEQFLKKDAVILQLKDNYNLEKITASEDGQWSTIPLVVLINRGSASASEIVASSLKDNQRAKLIGETSFGKGVVQDVYQFEDNSSLKLTVSEWLPPLGISINKKGVVPDMEVHNNLADPNNDAQLQAAIQALR